MIGSSASFITQLFRGTKIINLETIAKIMIALDLQCKVKITDKKSIHMPNEIKTYTTPKKISRVAED